MVHRKGLRHFHRDLLRKLAPNGTRTDAEHPWKNFILPPGPICIGKGFAVANQICGANLTAEGGILPARRCTK